MIKIANTVLDTSLYPNIRTYQKLSRLESNQAALESDDAVVFDLESDQKGQKKQQQEAKKEPTDQNLANEAAEHKDLNLIA